jgi:hypothetical protein
MFTASWARWLGCGSCALALAALFAGCADQGQGERCDPLNGNADCAPGLVCVKAESLALVEVGAVCCPPEGEDENAVDECRGDLQATDGGNPILPVDSGTDPAVPTMDSGGVAAGGTAGSDASADASP